MNLFEPQHFWPEELKTESRKFRDLNLRRRLLEREIENVDLSGFSALFNELENTRDAEEAQWVKCLKIYSGLDKTP